jgi:hypothetical protein
MITEQSLAPTFPGIPTQAQEEIDFGRQRIGHRVIVQIAADPKNNLGGMYEGDLSVTASLSQGAYQFHDLPLAEAYYQLLLGYLGEIHKHLNCADVGESAAGVAAAHHHFAELGIELHGIASRSTCSDPSRLATAVTFATSYVYALLQVARNVLGECDAKSVIVMDRYLGGIQYWDGAGLDWGYISSPTISRVHRTDLSRGLSYLASQADDTREDVRLNDLISLMGGGEATARSGVPSSVYTPIADAFRGTVASITREVASAAAEWRAMARQAAAENSAFLSYD